ncbi:MAG: AbrB/MazE/SpoVT family DNA-binding domain-containing protein [Candidatus Schekmanbacteria bacterium]|nr:AbrB/MazE/SpoVT family DNA-binding domain-containing protein [Candidatus Schekmanbacteria bacterium]
MIVKTSAKGQMVIPKKMRQRLNIKTGQALEISFTDNHLEIRPLPADPIRHLRGILKGGHSLTQELLRERRADDAKHENHRS